VCVYVDSPGLRGSMVCIWLVVGTTRLLFTPSVFLSESDEYTEHTVMVFF